MQDGGAQGGALEAHDLGSASWGPSPPVPTAQPGLLAPPDPPCPAPAQAGDRRLSFVLHPIFRGTSREAGLRLGTGCDPKAFFMPPPQPPPRQSSPSPKCPRNTELRPLRPSRTWVVSLVRVRRGTEGLGQVAAGFLTSGVDGGAADRPLSTEAPGRLGSGPGGGVLDRPPSHLRPGLAGAAPG